jgi:hypothetical protein
MSAIDLERILAYGLVAAAVLGITVYLVLRWWGSDDSQEK